MVDAFFCVCTFELKKTDISINTSLWSNNVQYIKLSEYELFHRYDYEGDVCINVFSNMVIYFDGYDRIVLDRSTNTFTYQNIETATQQEIEDYTTFKEELIFQYSTLFDVEKYIPIQEEMKKLNDMYE